MPIRHGHGHHQVWWIVYAVSFYNPHPLANVAGHKYALRTFFGTEAMARRQFGTIEFISTNRTEAVEFLQNMNSIDTVCNG
jgi:hypothetical protein